MWQEPSEETGNFSLKILVDVWSWWKEIFLQGFSSYCRLSWEKSCLPVLLLSTHSKAKHNCVHNGKKKKGYKPSTAQSYNDFMGEVHSSDAMLDSCTDERIRVKYWKNILSGMVLNSSITYKESKPMSRLDYSKNHWCTEWRVVTWEE